jgi:putative acetyltransferase
MDIRDERDSDQEAVRDVQRRAFGGQGPLIVTIVDDLRARPGTTSLVAVDGDRVVGHVMFSAALLDAPRRLVDVQVLSPLGVSPEHQRTGVGSALIRHGLAVLAGRGVPAVFVEGDPRYYGGSGFVAGGDVGFRKPSLRIPDAAFQVVRLPAHEPWMTGTLVYPSLWWEHDAVGLRDPHA